jgi:hypothetical protein
MVAVLTLWWGCSSDSDDPQSPTNPDDKATVESVFTPSERPTWAIDWMWNDMALPADWKDPAPFTYERAMELHVQLDDQFREFASEGDQMAAFLDGICRGVSDINPNKEFMLYIQGNNEEIETLIEVKYYCAQLKHMFTIEDVPFIPESDEDDKSNIVLTMGDGSAKYPYQTEIVVTLPDEPEYDKIADDLVFIFVGDECRAICISSDLWPGFKGTVFSRDPGEMVEVRYYSAAKGGYYTMKETVKLNNALQVIPFKY